MAFPRGPAPSNLVSVFIRHPNAANLLMVLMIVFGVFALARINTQFFPTVETSNVNVSISWSGASAEDVEKNVLALVEPSLRFIEGVDEMTSYAREGSGSVALEFAEGSDMQKAVADVETAVKSISTLPEDADEPTVSRSQWFDRVARVSISGDVPEETVRIWAKRMRDDLIERGIDRVTFTGLRDPELKVAIPERELRRLDLTISGISSTVASSSRDLPSGNLDGAVERQLRTVTDVESARGLGEVEVKSFASGEKVRLSDIATITDGYSDGVRGLSGNRPAIELNVQRTENADTLVSNRILQDYIAEIRPQLPTNMEVAVYSVRAEAVAERIMLLVKNGLSGLLLVIAVLFIFLNGRIAFWVAAGIPVALMATIGLMYVSGQSINMISLFGLIMMLGVIVDDAIVVGEHTDTRLQMGDDPVIAAERGVGDMFTPVTAALTTTIATFSPILLITGGIGQIIGVLPLVVVAVAIASIVECFFILPGHLAHSLQGRKKPGWSWWRVFFIALVLGLFVLAFVSRGTGEGGVASALPFLAQFDQWRETVAAPVWGAALASLTIGIAMMAELALYTVRVGFGKKDQTDDDEMQPEQENRFRRAFDRQFDRFRRGPFNWLVELAYDWRYVTVSVAVGLIMVVGVGLFRGGHVNFVFFPSPEAENISGNLVFHPGTPEQDAIAAIIEFENALRRAEQQLGGDEQLVSATFITLGVSGRQRADNVARINVQLTTSETRTIRTPDIVRAWNRQAPEIADVRRFSVRQSRGGPPGADIDIQLSGPSIGVLKEAASEVTDILTAISGVSGVEDDLPYGKPELVMTLKPRGAALGFSIDDVGRQVRNAVEGTIPRRFARGDDEIAIRLNMIMPQQGTAALRSMQLRSAAGNYVPLTEIVTLQEQQGFAAIQRKNGKTTISVSGDIDAAVNTTDGVTEQLLASGALETVSRKYGISYAFGGRSQEQREAFADLGTGSLIALSVIYIILAWVFGSYFRPFAVMLIIPFGIVGAVFGHWVLGFSLTILSMIGLLGLSGILVNDSIILVSRFEERLRAGEASREAIIGASRDRLRAVLLTSLTTIGGLVPLLFEKSLQAQFLMPMAITMVFGLASATLLVLFLVPVFIGIGTDIRRVLVAIYGRQLRRGKAASKVQPAE